MNSSASIVIMWCTVGSIIVGGAWAAFGLLSDLNELKKSYTLQAAQIAELSAASQTRSSEGAQGPMGPRGEQGAQGEQGPEGPTGPAPSNATLEALIQTAIEARPMASSTSSPSAIVAQPGLFDFTACVTVPQMEAGATFVVRKGMEICGPDGSLLVTVTEANRTNFYMRATGSSSSDVCGHLAVCEWPVAGTRPFSLERIEEDQDGTAYLIRFK